MEAHSRLAMQACLISAHYFRPDHTHGADVRDLLVDWRLALEVRLDVLPHLIQHRAVFGAAKVHLQRIAASADDPHP